jgi:hypothetical protein
MSVRLSTKKTSNQIRPIFMIFYIGSQIKICRDVLLLVEIVQNYNIRQVLYSSIQFCTIITIATHIASHRVNYNCSIFRLILKVLKWWPDDCLCSPKSVVMLRYKQMYLRLKDLWRIDWKVLHTQRYVLYKVNNIHFKRTLNAIRDLSVRIPSLTHTYCLRILATDLLSINRFIGHAPL